MKPYEILIYPDPRLFLKASEVRSFDDNLKMIVDRMFFTMKINEGIGLAAPQVNIQKRIIVIAFDTYNLTLINPIILSKSSETTGIDEGCLSVPSVRGFVKRSQQIKISYQDLSGTELILETNGLLSICIQHEIDHLNGVVYLNRMTELKRYFTVKKYNKLHKKN